MIVFFLSLSDAASSLRFGRTLCDCPVLGRREEECSRKHRKGTEEDSGMSFFRRISGFIRQRFLFFQQLYNQDKNFKAFVLDPTIKRRDKKAALQQVLKKQGVSDVTQNFFGKLFSTITSAFSSRLPF